MACAHGDDGADPPGRFPTPLDRFTKKLFIVLGLAILAVGVLLAEPGDGLVDGIAPSFVLVLFTWPQVYVMWRLYAHRRRRQIVERAAHVSDRGSKRRQ